MATFDMNGMGGNMFSFMGSPMNQQTMFSNNQNAQLPLAVDPTKATAYNLGNNLMPGEWDFLQGPASGVQAAMPNLAGMADVLGNQSAPMAGAPNSRVSVNAGSPKLGTPVNRTVAPGSNFSSFMSNPLMKV